MLLNIYCLVDVSIKYPWVKPLKHKNAKTILHGFAEIENESKRKPNKLWVYQGIEFYNSPIRPTLYCVILVVFNLKV